MPAPAQPALFSIEWYYELTLPISWPTVVAMPALLPVLSAWGQEGARKVISTEENDQKIE